MIELPGVYLPKGYGPRHAWVNQAMGLLYVLNELKPFIVVYKIDDVTGALTQLQEVSTALADSELGMAVKTAVSEGKMYKVPGLPIGQHDSHIKMTPDGRHLFSSTRGVGAIVGFNVHPVTGILSECHVR